MTVLTLDVGRTGCRAALWAGGERVRQAEGPSPAGLLSIDGTATVVRSMGDATTRLGELTEPPETVVAGVAGLLSAPDRADELLDGLATTFARSRVVVTSDAITSHAGALSGQPGVVVAAGTGTSVVAVDRDGTLHLVDGWGHLLGDDGSGYAIARAGIAAALRAEDGRAGSPALLDRLVARWGRPRDVPRIIQRAENPAGTVASFARDVFAAAADGDPVAGTICEGAATELARSAAAAAVRAGAGPSPSVASTGGLWRAGVVLSTPFERALREELPGATHREADADALAGAHLMALGQDLPHLRATGTVVADPDEGGPVAPTTAKGVDGDLARLETERSRPGVRLETMDVPGLVAAQLENDRVVQPAVETEAPRITRALEAVVDRLDAGGRLVYVGAGTPGRLALLDAAECLPTFGVGPETVTAVMAGGEAAMLRAVEGAEDDAAAGAEDVRALGIGPRDVVVGITASGRTPFVLGAVEAAGAAGAVTIGVTNNPGTSLAAAVDHPIETLTGPEFVTGSTRLKAGTAQKQVLNLLSTVAMIRLGKVHGTLMVDVHVTNEKLRLRGQRIVSEATGVGPDEAQEALEAAGGHAKTAIAALLLGLPATEAGERLRATRGRLGPLLGGDT